MSGQHGHSVHGRIGAGEREHDFSRADRLTRPDPDVTHDPVVRRPQGSLLEPGLRLRDPGPLGRQGLARGRIVRVPEPGDQPKIVFLPGALELRRFLGVVEPHQELAIADRFLGMDLDRADHSRLLRREVDLTFELYDGAAFGVLVDRPDHREGQPSNEDEDQQPVEPPGPRGRDAQDVARPGGLLTVMLDGLFAEEVLGQPRKGVAFLVACRPGRPAVVSRRVVRRIGHEVSRRWNAVNRRNLQHFRKMAIKMSRQSAGTRLEHGGRSRILPR